MNFASLGLKALRTDSIGPSWQMLHFPPPEMRILVPIRGVFSRRMTLVPSDAARQEANIPAAPAPITTISAFT